MRVLIKLGGAALASPATLRQTAELIRDHRARGHATWLVHGGGPAINQALTECGITWTFSGGQRVTTPEMIEVIERVLGTEVNGTVVRFFNEVGIPARGISGAQSLLHCRPAATELGRVGQIERVNDYGLDAAAVVPVIAPLGVGADGEVYNVNADWAAAHLAVALRVDELLFLTDQDGILDARRTMIPAIDSRGLGRLIEEGVVQGGMLTKTRAVQFALAHGVARVRIGRADRPELGTACTAERAGTHAST